MGDVFWGTLYFGAREGANDLAVRPFFIFYQKLFLYSFAIDPNLGLPLLYAPLGNVLQATIWRLRNSEFYLRRDPKPSLDIQGLHFIWPLPSHLPGMGGPTRSLRSLRVRLALHDKVLVLEENLCMEGNIVAVGLSNDLAVRLLYYNNFISLDLLDNRALFFKHLVT